jgi:hypothetical protein
MSSSSSHFVNSWDTTFCPRPQNRLSLDWPSIPLLIWSQEKKEAAAGVRQVTVVAGRSLPCNQGSNKASKWFLEQQELNAIKQLNAGCT